MALNGHTGTSKGEAAERERVCFIEAWTHQAMMAAVEEQQDDYPQIEKLAAYDKDVTYLGAEVKKLDEELADLQDALAEGSLVSMLLSAIRRACREATEQDENLYFFGGRSGNEE